MSDTGQVGGQHGHWGEYLADNASDVSFGALAGVLLLALMLVTVIDVFGRYVLNSPLPGSFELSSVLMAAIVYSGLPVVSRRSMHVTVDLLDPFIPVFGRRLQFVLVNLVCAAFFAIVAWRLWLLAGEAYRFGDVTEYLKVSRAPISWFGSVLCAAAALIHALNAFIGGKT